MMRSRCGGVPKKEAVVPLARCLCRTAASMWECGPPNHSPTNLEHVREKIRRLTVPKICRAATAVRVAASLAVASAYVAPSPRRGAIPLARAARRLGVSPVCEAEAELAGGAAGAGDGLSATVVTDTLLDLGVYTNPLQRGRAHLVLALRDAPEVERGVRRLDPEGRRGHHVPRCDAAERALAARRKV